MLPIESLEHRMATVMRTGLRKAMAYVDVGDVNNPLREVKASLESVLHNELRKQITITYAEGYIHGGYLIRTNAPKSAMLSAAAELLREDPRIVKATKAVIYSLGGNIGSHQNEIQAIIRTQYERGATVPMIAKRLGGYFDNNRVAATRFARTLTNDVYQRAHLDRYEDSGIVDGVEYSAHIDARTSDVCRMYNGTIWGLDDPDIKVPPLHFNCRSALNPYWGGIPGKRDFVSEFGSEFVDGANNTADVFRSQYWVPMPHTKASATLQRAYFDKRDLLTIKDGINQLIAAQRKTMHPDIIPLTTLKDRIRYRKTDIDPSTIADLFGKSLMLDKFERKTLKDALRALILDSERRRDRNIKEGLDVLAARDQDKIDSYHAMLLRLK